MKVGGTLYNVKRLREDYSSTTRHSTHSTTMTADRPCSLMRDVLEYK